MQSSRLSMQCAVRSLSFHALSSAKTFKPGNPKRLFWHMKRKGFDLEATHITSAICGLFLICFAWGCRTFYKQHSSPECIGFFNGFQIEAFEVSHEIANFLVQCDGLYGDSDHLVSSSFLAICGLWQFADIEWISEIVFAN